MRSRQTLLIETGDDPDDTPSEPQATRKPAKQNGKAPAPKRQPVGKPAPAGPDVGDGPGVDSDGYIGGAGGAVTDAGDPLFAKTWAEFNRAFAEQHPHFTGPEHVFSTVQLIYGGVPTFMAVRDMVPTWLGAYADLRDGGVGSDDAALAISVKMKEWAS